jgi:hypothetical protein
MTQTVFLLYGRFVPRLGRLVKSSLGLGHIVKTVPILKEPEDKSSSWMRSEEFKRDVQLTDLALRSI